MHHDKVSEIAACIECLPLTSWQVKARLIIGIATFFDAFDVMAIGWVARLMRKGPESSLHNRHKAAASMRGLIPLPVMKEPNLPPTREELTTIRKLMMAQTLMSYRRKHSTEPYQS